MSTPVTLWHWLAAIGPCSGPAGWRGAVAATGSAYPVLSGLIGGLGSFLTGSATSSDALLASLQGEVAGLLHVPAAVRMAVVTGLTLVLVALA